MTTQIEDANELLRAALDIIRKSGEGPIVRSAYQVETTAFGGGDGMCIAGDIEEYFRNYDVAREFQMPAEKKPSALALAIASGRAKDRK